MSTDDMQQQYETLLMNSDVYEAAILETIRLAIEGKHLSPEAALKTLITVAGRLSNDLLDGVNSFEYWALDYISFARSARDSETLQ